MDRPDRPNYRLLRPGRALEGWIASVEESGTGFDLHARFSAACGGWLEVTFGGFDSLEPVTDVPEPGRWRLRKSGDDVPMTFEVRGLRAIEQATAALESLRAGFEAGDLSLAPVDACPAVTTHARHGGRLRYARRPG